VDLDLIGSVYLFYNEVSAGLCGKSAALAMECSLHIHLTSKIHVERRRRRSGPVAYRQ